MVQVRAVLFIVGLILAAFAAMMAIPLLFDLDHGHRDWAAFAQAGAITAFVGGLLIAGCWSGRHMRFTPREGFLLTAVAWFAASLFGGLPFVFSDVRLSLTDSFFETASGLTTTGSTVVEKLSERSKGFLLWRAMLNGIGGVGIVVMAVALLPFLRVGGMQLFRSESSDKYDKPLPRAAQIAVATVLAYFALIAACAAVYWALGMSLFDAVTHAMPTVATGGFANYDESFAWFKSPALEWAATLFMAMGALPLVIYVRMTLGQWREVRSDSQVFWFLAVILAATLAIAAWLALTKDTPAGDALRLAAFNVVSVITTTGFASADFNAWGGFPGIVFIMLMFIGGCTGSTAGAIKVMRFEILGRLGAEAVRKLVHPRGVFRMRYQGKPIGDDVIASVTIFCFVYFISFAALTAAVAATGLDFVTSLTGAAQALGNIGPGLGEIIGPAGNFKPLPDTAKWLLAIGMILGRLEFMAVLVLFTRRFWRG
ncbi:MAG: TrkH family potassium uptake protein [Alphaproteobacteria bacterium]